ncbi:MAG TPA: hypothetical protein VGM95_01590 [Lactobacillaceae bacterium]|jgi:hypothetical protein
MEQRSQHDIYKRRPFENFLPVNWTNWKFWLPLGLNVASLNLIWWAFPLQYATHIAENKPHLTPLILFTIVVAVAFSLIITQNFRSYLSWPLLGLSGFLALNPLLHTRHEVFILLILLVAVLALLQQHWLGMQSILGLVLLTVLGGLAVPVSIFYLANGYLTRPFLWSLLPLMLSFTFTYTAILLPNAHGRQLSLLTAGLLVAALLSYRSDAQGLALIVLIAFAWLMQFMRAQPGNWQYSVLLVLQALIVWGIYH